MSALPADFPKMPKSVGGQVLPDFINAKVIERNVKLPGAVHPEKFDFSIKKSEAFGPCEGEVFDEGATWFPLKLVHFTCSDHGIGSYRGHYGKGATGIYGAPHPNDHKVSLAKDEYIKGISGTYTDKVTSLTITTTKATHKIGHASGKPFKFDAPKDHHVVGFHGRAENHIRAIGVSYSKRLASIAPATPVRPSELKGLKASATDPAPDIKPIYSNIFLDAATKAQWAANNMDAIEQKRNQAKNDIQPIYQNIQNNGETAWTLVESGGQQYYLSWSSSATMWSYIKDQPATASATAGSTDPPKTKTSIVSVGSYSVTANILGLSGYVWSNIPITAVASVIALTFVVLIRGLITDGVAWGIQYAATQLASAAAAAGVEESALMVPASVATMGGLVIAGIIGVGLFFAVMALASVLFRQYFLTVNVFNFDPAHAWNSLQWHGDNADISNGEWKNETIAKFAPVNAGVTPPGFNPVNNLENTVTYLSIAFENDSTFLQGLGVGMLLTRDDDVFGRCDLSTLVVIC
ncbi:hypothetical protein HGRIS_002191 [Hohenbuehelia grisea]|uniref:Jacalin-type lectin domain-containing protein n=1 Tax=Hohenbuehelia grisea TaxID=104357 RepID=A0ABR3JKH2_9AGAR